MTLVVSLCLTAPTNAADTGLTLVVTDGVNGQPLVEQKVYGYTVKANGTIASIPGSPFYTDERGLIELDGLDEDGTYYFKTVDPFNRWQRTDRMQPTGGKLAFRVGAQFAVNGVEGVTVESDTPEAFTDEALETQATVESPEPTPQPNEAITLVAVSAAIGEAQSVQHLTVQYVTLTNALSGDPIEGARVYAYRVNNDGANERVEGWPQTTDANGQVDASSLVSGADYYLKTRVYNRKWTRTDVFQYDGGDVDMPVGSLEVVVVDASQQIPGLPVPDLRVNIQKHLGGDQFETVQSIRSDDQGVIRTDVPGLGVDVEVRLQVENPTPQTLTIDGDNVTSDMIVAPGNYAFATAGELPQNPPANHVALQTINRATFGMNEDLLAQVDGMTHEQAVAWADAWILKQLEYPGGIAAPAELVFRDKIQGADRLLPYYPGTPQNPGSLGTLVPFTSEPAMTAFEARFFNDTATTEIYTTGVLGPNDFELDRYQLMHMIESPWQLREVMSQFWENHFSTEISASGNRRLVEFNEREGFRVDRIITQGRPTSEDVAHNYQMNYTNLAGINKDLSSSGALGNFPSLLFFSATNPSMCVYLNSADNKKGDPNENYAREVFELHCMGVDNGYKLADIKEASRVFTGWHINSGPKTKPGVTGYNYHNAKFDFKATHHSNGSGEFDENGNPITNPNKTTIIRFNADYNPATDPPDEFFVYGPIVYRSGETGVEEGLELLDRLTRIRETASFISGKLIELFVSDEPLPDLQNRVADVFEANVDHPEQVKLLVYTILTSPEFRALENFRSKFKTPTEDTTGLHRHLMPNATDIWVFNPSGNANGGNGEYGAPRTFLDAASMGLFAKVEPTGYPENGADWLDTDGLLKRLNHHYDVALNNYIGSWTIPNPNPDSLTDSKGLRAYRWMKDVKGFTTKTEVIDYLLALLTNGYATNLERGKYEELLDTHQAFNLVNPGSTSRQDDNIRLLICAILTSPQYIYQ
jgi:uncharacterized protein (DUF1800 family)